MWDPLHQCGSGGRACDRDRHAEDSCLLLVQREPDITGTTCRYHRKRTDRVELLFAGPTEDKAARVTTELPRLAVDPLVLSSHGSVTIALPELSVPLSHAAMDQLVCTAASAEEDTRTPRTREPNDEPRPRRSKEADESPCQRLRLEFDADSMSDALAQKILLRARSLAWPPDFLSTNGM